MAGETETEETLPVPDCWCGVENPYFEDLDGMECGGDGHIICICGGDQCVCHWHGTAECSGCVDCQEDLDGGLPI